VHRAMRESAKLMVLARRVEGLTVVLMQWAWHVRCANGRRCEAVAT
jgi:hypothetical protein